MLAEQATTRTVRLVLWNNKPEYTSRYVRDIEKFGPTGALARIELFESAHNLGGIARFVVGRQIIREGYIGPFITLDDDQDVSPTFVHDLLAAHRPATIAGFWAYAYGADYWDRRALRDGEEASYVGTGGAIFDSAIVSDRTFFTALPPKYGFIEDIWACHRVRRDGGTLRKVDTPVIMVQEELNQHHDLISLKREFVSYLEQHPER